MGDQTILSTSFLQQILSNCSTILDNTKFEITLLENDSSNLDQAQTILIIKHPDASTSRDIINESFSYDTKVSFKIDWAPYRSGIQWSIVISNSGGVIV